jgi:hypothetical protein
LKTCEMFRLRLKNKYSLSMPTLSLGMWPMQKSTLRYRARR